MTVDWRDRRRHFRGVIAARQVLAFQFLLRLVDERLVVRAALRQTDGAQRLRQVFLVELVNAREVDCADGGAFLNAHGDDIAFGGNPHVIEKAGGIERANRFGSLIVRSRTPRVSIA